MIPQETVDLILDTARIEDVVGDFLTLRRRGANLVACCPFHNEKTPSFYVSPAKGMFKCFGCGKAGSAVGFLMEHEHITYPEALRYLADKYHIEVREKEESAEDLVLRQRRESLLLASDFAQKFYVDALQTEEGRAYGLAYYHNRGIDDETIARFGLGWAPRSRSALTDAARAAGYKLDYLADLGLCVRHDDGRFSDRFYERVMFPIYNLTGKVIGYSGRTLRSDYKELNIGKYVNTPETELYHKSAALYGIFSAKGEIAREDKCYLLEGNIDVVSMSRLGIRNVVASCGTSLTEEQIRIIKKFTNNITIMYDGDAAGIHAALRAIDLILQEGMTVRVVLFPDGDDPDSFACRHTLEEVREFIASNEKDFIEYKVELLEKDAGNDPIKRAEILNELVKTLSYVSDDLQKSVYTENVARRFNTKSDALFARIRTFRLERIEEKKKEEERARRRAEAGLDPAGPDTPEANAAPVNTGSVESKMEILENDKIVSNVEKDILTFLLMYGSEELDFPTDSPYYSGSEDTKAKVADFILEQIEADGNKLLNKVFDKVYHTYVSLYDENYTQEEIVRKMVNSPDPELSFVTAQLSIEKYQLTVAGFAASMTTKASWLVAEVPNLMLVYCLRKVESQLKDIAEEIKTAGSEDAVELLQRMLALQQLQRRIEARIAKEKKHY